MNSRMEHNEASIFDVRRYSEDKMALSHSSLPRSPPLSPSCYSSNPFQEPLPPSPGDTVAVESPQALKELVAKAAAEKLDLYRNTSGTHTRRQGRRKAFCLKKRKRDEQNYCSRTEFLDLLQVPICEEGRPRRCCEDGCPLCDESTNNDDGHEDQSLMWLSLS